MKLRLVLLLGLLAGLVVAQPPAEKPQEGKDTKPPARPLIPKGFPQEAEEPIAPTNLKKIEFLDDEDGPASGSAPKGAAYFPLKDVTRAAAKTTFVGIKDSLNKFTLAFDRILDTDGKQTRACPIPVHFPDKFPNPFGYFEISPTNTVMPLKKFDTGKLRRVDAFEELAVEEARKMADPPNVSDPTKLNEAPASARLDAAETLLTAVLFTHETMREQGKRKGKPWDEVRNKLYKALQETRINRLNQAATDKDWALVGTLGSRVAALYPENKTLLASIALTRLAEAEFLIGADRPPTDLERARAILDEFRLRNPGQAEDRVASIEKALLERSKKLLEQADNIAASNRSEAGKLLTTISRIDPENPKIRELQMQLKLGYSVLAIGTKRLPERISPATARWDSELAALDLLFEGLMEPVPDEVTGLRYRPALAMDRPEIIAAGRTFALAPLTDWGSVQRGLLDPADVLGTVKLLRAKPELPSAAMLDWIGEPRSDSPGQVRFPLERGYIDPRALVNFKVLPARWLLQNNKAIDDLAFASRPFGTGPYRHQPTEGVNAKSVSFTSNPGYSRRPGHPGEPNILEVRFVDVNGVKDLPRLFESESIHLMTDIPTQDIGKFDVRTVGGSRVSVVTTQNNRRIHLLAINIRKPELRDAAIRKGLAYAIDREAILGDVYRLPGDATYHQALTGPFPAKAWATAKPNGAPAEPLTQKDKAQANFATALKDKNVVNFSLLYCDDDARNKKACELMKKNIETLATTDGGKIVVNLEPATPTEFYQRVYNEFRYQLAYVSHDYDDDWFPYALGSLLDPNAAGAGGRNIMGFRTAEVAPGKADEQLGRLLSEVRLHRDFQSKVVPLAHQIHTAFNDSMPFVPLWQIDRHIAISSKLKLILDPGQPPIAPRMLDATRPLRGISTWKID